jgi:hypothetical protein
MLVLLVALCDAAGAADTKPMTAQVWLAAVPQLPSTAESAYAEWTDVSGELRPGPAFEKVTAGIKAQTLDLSRPYQSTAGAGGASSAHDQALVSQITVFPATATVVQNVQATRTAQAALVQKWRAELNTLEQRRLQERSALPACRNEAGAPSQIAIRDVERAFAEQRIAVANRYLAQYQTLVAQLKSAVAPRIEHGDSALAAWSRLRNARLKVELAPAAHGAASDALQDVELVQSFIEEASKLAARPVAERHALERVYAQASGCG